MPPLIAVIWAAATGVAIVAVGAGVITWTHPSFLWPETPPTVVTDSTPPPTSAPAPDKLPAPEPARAPETPGPTAAAGPSAPAPVPSAVKPTFDVVSVEPTGEAVVAGRAAPNVKVALLDGGRTVAEAKSDAQGQFVMIPAPLPPGDHSLSLSSGDGGPVETSVSIPVSVAAPAPNAAAAPPSATQSTPAPLAQPSSPPTESVAIRSVEANAQGGMVAVGAAAPNATVRLYVSGAFVGDAKTKDDGRWSLTIERGMSPGAYAVRADVVDPHDAKVVARAETPFTIPKLTAPGAQAANPPPQTAPAPVSPADIVVTSVQSHHVERGHTLWGISQKFYGDGSRYAVIFSANTGQIRNPNLIYPGQTFVVPKVDSKP